MTNMEEQSIRIILNSNTATFFSQEHNFLNSAISDLLMAALCEYINNI